MTSTEVDHVLARAEMFLVWHFALRQGWGLYSLVLIGSSDFLSNTI